MMVDYHIPIKYFLFCRQLPKLMKCIGLKYLFQLSASRDEPAIIKSFISNAEYLDIFVLLQCLLWELTQLTLENLAKGAIGMSQ